MLGNELRGVCGRLKAVFARIDELVGTNLNYFGIG
jgi:hypothetical protein